MSILNPDLATRPAPTGGMDVARTRPARSRRRPALIALGVGLLLAITLGVSRLRPAAPAVATDGLWIGTVERGEMVRQVRGSGTLVPEQIRWVAAATAGRVDRLRVLPGSTVAADTVVLELSNPELQQQAQQARTDLRAAEARLAELRVRLTSQRLDQEATLARMESEQRQARLRADADETLARQGLVADLTRRISALTAEELAGRSALERRRLTIGDQAIEAQLAVQQAEVDQRRALLQLRVDQVAGLAVRAGIDGVLQQVPVEIGAQVEAGTNLARISQPDKLKAVVRIAETQARDVQVGLAAVIDTRNGEVAGRVVRVDPAVQNGTVTVDVAIEDPLPRGARPDLTVDVTIEIERLADVLHLGRPAVSRSDAPVGLFRLETGGREATRTTVQLGAVSVGTVEVRAGLAEGDRVILSDMSAWDAHDRLRLN